MQFSEGVFHGHIVRNSNVLRTAPICAGDPQLSAAWGDDGKKKSDILCGIFCHHQSVFARRILLARCEGDSVCGYDDDLQDQIYQHGRRLRIYLSLSGVPAHGGYHHIWRYQKVLGAVYQ